MMTVYWKSLSEVRDTDGVQTKRPVEMKTQTDLSLPGSGRTRPSE